VTVAGAVTEALFEASAIAAPPVGAGRFKLTVPVAPVPPVTEAGAMLTLAR